MPILDKLNTKLEEAGVEERGHTIEEAVDLLPAMGGSGGLQFEQIGTTHDVGWFDKSAGHMNVTYYRIGGEGSNIFIIYIEGSGSPVTIDSSFKEVDKHPNVVTLDAIGQNGAFPFTPLCNNSSSITVNLFLHDGAKALLLYTGKNLESVSDVSQISGYCMVIGKLADNIT